MNFPAHIWRGSLFAFAVVSYFVTIGIWNLLSFFNRQREFRYRAVLIKGVKKIEVTAILDTGNTLRDPLTGAAVSVLCKTVAEKIVGTGRSGRIRMDQLSFCRGNRKGNAASAFRHNYTSKERKYSHKTPVYCH